MEILRGKVWTNNKIVGNCYHHYFMVFYDFSFFLPVDLLNLECSKMQNCHQVVNSLAKRLGIFLKSFVSLSRPCLFPMSIVK